MEVSRRRILLKHLEPARPLRRCIPVDVEPQPLQTRIPNARNMMKQETLIDVEQFVQIVSFHKPKRERISYTRDFLIGLASCPEARKRPEHLPEHCIVLSEARDPWKLELGVAQWNGGRGDMES